LDELIEFIQLWCSRGGGHHNEIGYKGRPKERGLCWGRNFVSSVSRNGEMAVTGGLATDVVSLGTGGGVMVGTTLGVILSSRYPDAIELPTKLGRQTAAQTQT
jgi:hypothetical protein